MKPKSIRTNNTTTLQVSVGILVKPNGQVLMAQRPPGKPSAGYWEFPGGKIETGETPEAALSRELHEELGIDIQQAFPWLNFQYNYPDRQVHLHFYRITNWSGEPEGREGQKLSWQNPNHVSVSPLLPANHQLMHTLTLPDTYAITYASKTGAADFLEKLDSALQRGIQLIQVREPRMKKQELILFSQQVIAAAKPYNARVLINGDEQLVRSVNADGIHLPSRQLMNASTRPDFSLCAASCHNIEELHKAVDLDLDFVVLSPVLPTASHPGKPTLGWETLETLCKDVTIPVYALGGMKNDSMNTAMAHRAHGIAMLRGAW